MWASRVIKCSLMPRPSQKAEEGSGVLSDISCHMGQGLQHKECHTCTVCSNSPPPQ